MSLPGYAVTSDGDLVSAVRGKTSYSDTSDELPGDGSSGNQMEEILNDAKRELHSMTGSDQWYADLSYGQALVAMVALKAKEAVENINIASYGIGDEQLSFTNADPESSQQIQSWSAEVEEHLAKSEVEFDKDPDLPFSNTTSYIG